MDNITIFGQPHKHLLQLQRTVELLQKKNSVRVATRDEREPNATRICEEKRRAKAIAADKQANRIAKGKQKAIGANKQKDNALVELRQQRNDGVVIRNELELRIRQVRPPKILA